MHCNCLPFLDGFVQHDDNTFMDDGAGGIAHPVGDLDDQCRSYVYLFTILHIALLVPIFNAANCVCNVHL
jgi:hypothetical protein